MLSCDKSVKDKKLLVFTILRNDAYLVGKFAQLKIK